MKKILFVINTLRIGGAEKSLVSLLQALDYEKYDVDLLLFEDDGILKKDLPEDVHVIYAGDVTRAMILEFRYYGNSLLRSFHIPAYLARLRISLDAKKQNREFSWNIIGKHIPPLKKEYDLAVSYLEGYPAYYVIDKVTASHKIAWIHTDFSKKKLYEKEKEYYCQFDRIATISQKCRNAITDRIPELNGKVSVIENLSDPKRLRSLAEEPADFRSWEKKAYNIVTVGRLTEAKGIDLAVKTCQILKNQNPGICWHVYGEGELHDSLQRLIDENSLNNEFILEGAAVNPYPYMKMADMIVQPSKWEGKSVVLDEAKILGKAIIVTDYPTAKDQITDGETGLIVAKDPEQIAKSVTQLLYDSELKQKLEDNCLKEKPAYETTLAQINRILDCEGEL